jgi:aspartate 1-decarboxylase
MDLSVKPGLILAGSLTISPELLTAADIGAHELLQVISINNGAQFETYTISARRAPPR